MSVVKRNYIGVACSLHEPAVAIVNSRGEVVFAEATERSLQNKRALGCVADEFYRIPKLIRAYCEKDADLVVARTWSEDFLANQSKRIRRAHGTMKLFRALMGKSDFIRRRYFGDTEPAKLEALLDGLKELQSYIATLVDHYKASGMAIKYHCNDLFRGSGRKVIFKNFDHHLNHAAYACHASPFSEATCAVIDGEGEQTSMSFYSFRDGRVNEIAKQRPKNEASLGEFYTFMTEICGFDTWAGEEWKMMGLASYGSFDQDLHGLIKSTIEIDGLRVKWPQDNFAKFLTGRIKLLDMRRPPSESALEYANLASTAQSFFTETTAEIMSRLHALAPSDNLVYCGGCALNSSFNGQIIKRTPFENLFVPSAPGDDGASVGAALLAFMDDHSMPSNKNGAHSAYLGSVVSDFSLNNLRSFHKGKITRLPSDQVCEKAAELLAEGKILGWVQGRAEFGPRALGNRSILADPRAADVKDRINSSVKFREEFRPFAPAILHEFGPEYFVNYQESPYMERTLRFRDEVVTKVPGVVHVDQTGRLQTVKQEWNERFYALLVEFHRLTGVPVLLNTSFNVMGKPIVHSVEDAISVFYTTGLDALVIHDEIIEK